VDIVEIFQAGSVVCVALHQYQLGIDLKWHVPPAARRQSQRLQLPGSPVFLYVPSAPKLRPGDLTRAYLESWDKWIQHVDRLKIVWEEK
jgi:hypothetical protein